MVYFIIHLIRSLTVPNFWVYLQVLLRKDYGIINQWVVKNCLYIKGNTTGMLLSKVRKQQFGPKFIYIKSIFSTKLHQNLGQYISERLGFHSRSNTLPLITRRQFNNNGKLSFILPNIDGAKIIGPLCWNIISVLVGS